MWSWWGSASSLEEPQRAPRKTVKTKQVHVEVIGGSNTFTTNWNSKQSAPATRSRQVETVVGPSRLPSELIIHILLLAAESLAEEGPAYGSLLQLASVDRGGHHAILTTIILPQIRLSGLQQVKAFARDLQRNVLNLQNQVKRVKKLTIRRARERATLEFMRASSLFSGAEELAQFEKATLEPLKVILFYCSNLQHLSLDMPARVLDSRQQQQIVTGAESLPLGHSLTELVTLLSVYGGDLNEALWSPGESPISRWSNLTHLQLHGPRFRMTSLTALAIGQLPSLTHLALIMPLLVQPQTYLIGSNEPDYQVNTARDALGRCNVLQVLINALGNRLHTLLLLCHDIENYVGNVQRLGSWIQTLQWKCNSTIEEDEKLIKDPTKLILVTARPHNPLQTNPHPSLYSKWMLQRAERGVHWDWKQDEIAHDDMCEEMKLSYTVESWNIPIVYESRLVFNLEEINRRNREEFAQQVDNDLARRWMGIDSTEEAAEQDDSGFQSYTSDEPNGIDNLD